MVDWSFSRLTSELLAILRDRYPAGLTTSIDQPEGTAVPSSDDDVKLAYANIKVRPDDTVGSKGLKDNCSLAFAVLEPDADEGSVKFQVELPAVEEDEEM
ncbi:hypothetical protein N0V88_007919 [Collariella sp. IMI 366227]|nr:hypothetical protein N0V88_007919 [Collariella sp. IMI 366227]